MKYIFTLLALFFISSIYAQSLGYNDIGVMLTGEDNNGTARFRAMGGAFGALGGDLNSIEVNPAGTAVFLKSEFSSSLNIRNQSIYSNYYGTGTSTKDNYTTLSQMGAVFVVNHGYSDWKNTAIGFNYSLSRDFKNYWAARGNSGFATFIYDEDYTDDGDDTNDDLYLNTEGQFFDNYTSGKNNKYTFSFASQYKNNLYLGASFNIHDVRLYQSIYLEEDNYNDDGEKLPVYLSSLQEELLTFGSGFSFSLGAIYKATDNVRFGLAYQSPIWYNLTEEFLDNDGFLNGFNYSMQSPGKFTGSFAYIFGKKGLISLDYVYKNYQNIKLTPSYDFIDENNDFNRYLQGTSEVRVGTEWRVEKLSLRGGYYFQQSPYKDSISSDSLSGFSAGLGYNFGIVKLDFAWEKSNQTSVYDFYPQYDEVDAANLEFDTSKYTFTVVFSI